MKCSSNGKTYSEDQIIKKEEYSNLDEKIKSLFEKQKKHKSNSSTDEKTIIEIIGTGLSIGLEVIGDIDL